MLSAMVHACTASIGKSSQVRGCSTDPRLAKAFCVDDVDDRAMTGDNMEMRAIIIVENRAQCETPNVRKLLEFFASNRGLRVKIVLASDWETSKIDHAISPSCIEFGIHGEKLVYQADKYEPVSIGTWSRSSIEIKRFTSFFDAVWGDNKLATGVSSVAKESSSLSELMAIDSTHERRHNGVHEAVTRIEERINAA